MLSRPAPFLTATIIMITVVGFAVWPSGRETPMAFADPRPSPKWPADGENAEMSRTLALRSAKVWNPTDPALADLATNPTSADEVAQPLVRCKFLPGPATGTTTKFDCALTSGEVVKVKYGHTGE